MKKLVENYQKFENILFNILIGMFIINITTLVLIILSNGHIWIGMAALVLPSGIFFLGSFIAFIFLLIAHNKNNLYPDIKKSKTIIGLLLSPLGLLFSFFNFMAIILINI